MLGWLGIAVLSHSLNAIVFAADTSLLRRKSWMGRPLALAVSSGLVAGSAALFLLVSPAAPTWLVVQWSFVAGVLWLAALWLFFAALKQGEPSRVVPVVGSAVPLFTSAFAMLLLHEQLLAHQWWAIGLLIAGSVILSIRLTDAARMSWSVLGMALASGALFALYFVTVKFLYDSFDPFLAAFAYSRLGVGMVAVVLFLVFLPRKHHRPAPAPARGAWVGFWISKGLATVALLLQNWAIALGSVTVVNALQGVQYISLLGLAYGISRWYPGFFQEERRRLAWAQKIVGICVVSIGLVLLVMNPL